MIDAVDPGSRFAAAVGGQQIEEDRFDFGIDQYDLVIAIGTLDTVNELPLAMQLIHRAMRPDSPFIGAIAGGNSLPLLRNSLIEAGRLQGRAIARTHPRIEPSALATPAYRCRILDACGRCRPDYASLRQPSFTGTAI